jgi:glycyl-tRNA synthetase beta chain
MNKSLQDTPVSNDYVSALTEPAEKALLAEIETRSPVIDRAVERGDGFREAFAEASRFKPAVDRFFDEVLVMTPDPELRQRRLALLWRLVTLILKLGDISEIVAEG